MDQTVPAPELFTWISYKTISHNVITINPVQSMMNLGAQVYIKQGTRMTLN